MSNSRGAELLIQAEHAAKARERALANQDAAAAAIRSVDLLKQKLVAAESDRMVRRLPIARCHCDVVEWWFVSF